MHRKLIVLGAHDVEWIDQTVSILKRRRRKTNGSELIRLGLSLLREMNEDELQRRLREFE